MQALNREFSQAEQQRISAEVEKHLLRVIVQEYVDSIIADMRKEENQTASVAMDNEEG